MTLFVEVRCPHYDDRTRDGCGRLLFKSASTSSGCVEVKCPRCRSKSVVPLGLARSS